MGTVTLPSPSHHHHSNHKPSSLCPSFIASTNFPNTFQDFFTKLSEEGDDNDENIMSLLEDKQLLPPTGMAVDGGFRRKLPERHWSMNRKSFRRRNNEMQAKGNGRTEGRMPQQQISLPCHGTGNVLVSPMTTRRRSSSIAVTRVPPDLNRFLQTEQQRPRLQVKQKSSSPEPQSRPISPRPPRHSPVPPTEGSSYNRCRTASVPAVPSRHRPMLAQTRRNDDGMEYYRLRSFSITPQGVFNLGDSFKSRRSLSINSVNSSESSLTDISLSKRNRLPSTTSQSSTGACEENDSIPTFRVAMLGAPGVGKTALTYQFTTSEYICAYDTSLDDEFGQKTVSVMLDGQETELEIIDHPSSEMSVEAFCSTYSPDVYVVVYSVVDRKSLKMAEEILLYLWKSDYMAARGVILVGNKADLERKREVSIAVGRRLANNCGCKFIETSSGLDHNVDELLVGILAQVQLNPRRQRNHLSKKKKSRLSNGRRLLKHLLGLKRKSKSHFLNRTKPAWFTETEKDLKETGITAEDLHLRDTLKKKVEEASFQEKPKLKTGGKWTEERRREHSKRMKEYWKRRKEKERNKKKKG